jgi:hypothetical protein
MAALAWTYATLAAALQDWPENDDADYVAAIPMIVQLGEMRALRELDLEGKTEVVVTTGITTSVATIAKPTPMVASRDLYYTSSGQEYHMIRAHPDWVRAYNAMGVTGLPRYFADDNETQWIVAPIPNFTAASGLNVRLTRNPAGLDSGAPSSTSWLGTNVPDLLLSSCLMMASRYLKNDPKWATFKRDFDLTVSQAKGRMPQLKRVQFEDQVANREVTRPQSSDANSQEE